ncbi:MAG: acyltransferase family protein [Burkholderiaceae bacterium]
MKHSTAEPTPSVNQIILSHDGLRGVAALLVAVFHIAQNGQFAHQLTHIPFIANAWILVDFFFVLSGFMMAWSYGDRLKTGTDAKVFLVRRFGRLYPLHLVMLLGFAATWTAIQTSKWLIGLWHPEIQFSAPAFSGPEVSWDNLLLHVFLLQGVGLQWTDSFNFPAWSVSLELWTYLLFTAVCVGIGTGKRCAIVFLGLSIGSLLFYVLKAPSIEDFAQTMMIERNFFRILLSFGLGVACARVRRKIADAPSGVRQLQAAAAIACLLMIWVVDQIGVFVLAAPLLFAALVTLLAYDSGKIGRSLTCRPMLWLGARSYSIYMVHATILLVAKAAALQLAPSWDLPLAGLYVVAVLVAADLSYRFLEVPSRDAFRRLADSIRKPQHDGTENAGALVLRS